MNKTNLKQENKDEVPTYIFLSYMALRKTIGILGILLPVILGVGSLIVAPFHDSVQFESSISNYYYTFMGDIFVAILCSVALFLFCYEGPDKIDGRAGNVAGLFALCTALLPTTLKEDICFPGRIIPYEYLKSIGTIHLVSAALFFITLSYFSLFLFTKKSKNPTPEKLKRNKVYRVCGYVMLAAIGLLIPYFAIASIKEMLDDYKFVFCMETIALWAFGVSWLTKGEFILKDK